MNIFSFVYLAVFLLAGFCIARRALPQAGLSVSIPLGCGFGVSLLAFVSACFAVVLGFRLPALLLAAAVVAALAVWLARHGTPFTRVPDPDAAALWACATLGCCYPVPAAHPCAASGRRQLSHRAKLLWRYGDAPGIHQKHCRYRQAAAGVSPAGRRAPVRLPVFVRDRFQRFLVLGQTPAPLTCCPCWPHSPACTA